MLKHGNIPFASGRIQIRMILSCITDMLHDVDLRFPVKKYRIPHDEEDFRIFDVNRTKDLEDLEATWS